MKESARKYKKAYVKQKIVDFGIHDQDIFEYSKTINFSKFVKDILRESMNDADLMIKYKKAK